MLRSQSLSFGSACCLPLHLPLVTNYCIMAHEIIPSDRRRPPGPAAQSCAVHHRKPTSRNEKVLNSNVQICIGQLRLLPPRRERPNRELPTVRNRREVKGFCLRYRNRHGACDIDHGRLCGLMLNFEILDRSRSTDTRVAGTTQNVFIMRSWEERAAVRRHAQAAHCTGQGVGEANVLKLFANPPRHVLMARGH